TRLTPVHWRAEAGRQLDTRFFRGRQMNRTLSRVLAAMWTVLAGLGAGAEANVRVPAILGRNMVLQGGKALPGWGWGEPGEEVTVTLGAAKESTKADDKGKWQVTLPAQKASSMPVEMTVAGKNSIKVQNILIGEVWGGSGQSNMQWSVEIAANANSEIAAAN